MNRMLQNAGISLISLLILISSGGCSDNSNGLSAGGSAQNGSTNGSPAANTTAVDELIDELCAAVARCDSTLTKSGCITAMNGEAGRQIWDDFGLQDQENELTAAQIETGISSGTITVNEPALVDCLHELIEACDNEGESFPIGSYDNSENLILQDGACPSVLQTSE